MKKIFFLGAVALLGLMCAQQPASAWLNFKFGAGINWAWQSGGNNTLWGLFRNGQPPGFGPQYDPSAACNTMGCGSQGAGPFGGGCQQGGAYMSGPGGCPPPAQSCPTMPGQCPTGQMQGQYPYFPGLYPYSQDQFQFFGNSPPQGGADMTAQVAKYWYQTAQQNQATQTTTSQYGGNYYPTTYSTSNYGGYSYPSTSTSYYPGWYGYPGYYNQGYYGYGYRRY